MKCEAWFTDTLDSLKTFCSISCKLAFDPSEVKRIETEQKKPLFPVPLLRTPRLPPNPERIRKEYNRPRSVIARMSVDELIQKDKKWKRHHHGRYVKRLERAIRELSEQVKGSTDQSKQENWGFYGSDAWRKLRFDVLKKSGRRCALCRTTEGKMHVDHIKPRSLYPELELTESNLQVLCEACNLGKGNRDETDWRETAERKESKACTGT